MSDEDNTDEIIFNGRLLVDEEEYDKQSRREENKALAVIALALIIFLAILALGARMANIYPS